MKDSIDMWLFMFGLEPVIWAFFHTRVSQIDFNKDSDQRIFLMSKNLKLFC